MSQKQTVIETLTDKAGEVAQDLGIVTMVAATTIGLLGLHDKRLDSRAIVPNQPSFAVATDNDQTNNPIRREKEEVGVHYISYSETQRTPGRTGKF